MTDRTARMPLAAGAMAALVALIVLVLLPDRIRTSWRETASDRAMSLGRSPPATAGRPVVFVDVDRQSLAEIGPWPWPRGVMAELVETVFRHGASAVAFDILFAGPDQRSPGTVLRRLAGETGDAALGAASRAHPDGDQRLAEAMRGKPVALSVLLDPAGAAIPAAAPVLSRGAVRLERLWTEAGAQTPVTDLAATASGFGVASLQADADGLVRRVPLLVRVGGVTAPGLAAEAVRIVDEASAFLVTAPPLRMMVGDAEIALPPDGMLRLLPASVLPDATRLSVSDMLGGKVELSALRQAVVIVGASAPELGGLRASLLGPLSSSAALQAQAVRQIMAGIAPMRPLAAEAWELAAALILGLLVAFLAARLRPALAVGAALALATACLGVAVAAAARDVLIDPAPALVAMALALPAAVLAATALVRRREAQLRRRFAQHLAPDVVERIVAEPESLRLQGETRLVTALFTDIEGFSATVASARPDEVIAVLDSYFEGVATIVVKHGGMIDKFVGDAVHAFFNMPLDLPSHADRAVACAIEIARWTEGHRCQGPAAGIGLGRTRIGIETGNAIVGDVGLSTKLDYTAHGPAVNLAARLDEVNKQLGTAICVGPGAAAACISEPLRPLGTFEVRGFGPLLLYAPAGP